MESPYSKSLWKYLATQERNLEGGDWGTKAGLFPCAPPSPILSSHSSVEGGGCRDSTIYLASSSSPPQPWLQGSKVDRMKLFTENLETGCCFLTHRASRR